MTYQYVLELGHVVQRIIERHDRAARIPEQRVHTFCNQGLRQPAGTVHYAASVCLGVVGVLAACAPSHFILLRSFLPMVSMG